MSIERAIVICILVALLLIVLRAAALI